jgi:hypothetical protein
MIDMALDRESLLEEEYIIVRNSGEIPEIALHSSLYYLVEDDDGPRITLLEHERQHLFDAAIARAQEIVLRDLDPRNRDLPIYRGPARTIANWNRLQQLCQRISRQCPGFEDRVADALVGYLAIEVEEVLTGCRRSSVNCSAREMEGFCRDLGLDPSSLPAGWRGLCRN